MKPVCFKQGYRIELYSNLFVRCALEVLVNYMMSIAVSMHSKMTFLFQLTSRVISGDSASFCINKRSTTFVWVLLSSSY